MKTAVATVLSLLILPMIKAMIICYECEDCTAAGVYISNRTCLSNYDTCMKLDFASYVIKRCGNQDQHCNKEGFKANMGDTWNRIKARVGDVAANAALETNYNSGLRKTLNCCQDRNYCNSGMKPILSMMAALAVVFAKLIA